MCKDMQSMYKTPNFYKKYINLSRRHHRAAAPQGSAILRSTFLLSASFSAKDNFKEIIKLILTTAKICINFAVDNGDKPTQSTLLFSTHSYNI